jgi:hypothetical protein
MTSRRTGGVVVALAALLLWLPGAASAHPQLVGEWAGQVTPGAVTVYDFGPGQYLGPGMWRGPYTITVSGCVTSSGEYVLRLYHGGEGTLALRDGLWISTRVAVIDLGVRAFEFMGVIYRH